MFAVMLGVDPASRDYAGWWLMVWTAPYGISVPE
jgi:hypothetical protein